jgi:hypothetical protein
VVCLNGSYLDSSRQCGLFQPAAGREGCVQVRLLDGVLFGCQLLSVNGS